MFRLPLLTWPPLGWRVLDCGLVLMAEIIDQNSSLECTATGHQLRPCTFIFNIIRRETVFDATLCEMTSMSYSMKHFNLRTKQQSSSLGTEADSDMNRCLTIGDADKNI